MVPVWNLNRHRTLVNVVVIRQGILNSRMQRKFVCVDARLRAPLVELFIDAAAVWRQSHHRKLQRVSGISYQSSSRTIGSTEDREPPSLAGVNRDPFGRPRRDNIICNHLYRYIERLKSL